MRCGRTIGASSRTRATRAATPKAPAWRSKPRNGGGEPGGVAQKKRPRVARPSVYLLLRIVGGVALPWAGAADETLARGERDLPQVLGSQDRFLRGRARREEQHLQQSVTT